MRLFGFDIGRSRAVSGEVVDAEKQYPAVSNPTGAVNIAGSGGYSFGWMGAIMESFAGAWQQNVTVESRENILANSAVYACLGLIADDISKLAILLTQRQESGIWAEVQNPAYSPVLRKPNNYQNRIQFLQEWMLMKLIYGNTYVLLERDRRGVVSDMYVLDSRRVTPMVAPDGSVFYNIKSDYLAGLANDITLPASEIIHDRMYCFFHPLCGIPPIYACGRTATQAMRIQDNSSKFFANMSRPSGVLTAPGTIKTETADRIKREWESNFAGQNIGRLAVLGDGLKYEAMTIPPEQAQLVEQLNWTVRDAARCFKVPLHKIDSVNAPSFNNIGQLNQDYYSQCLQEHIESIELCLSEGLAVPADARVELDTEAGLFRMDPAGRAEVSQKLVVSGQLAPNEGRLRENLPPVKGGELPYMQQQMVPLDKLAEGPKTPVAAPAATPPADAPGVAPKPAPPAGDQPPPDTTPPPKSIPTSNDDDTVAAFTAALLTKLAKAASDAVQS
jgi:HK97 family phage portal protein